MAPVILFCCNSGHLEAGCHGRRRGHHHPRGGAVGRSEREAARFVPAKPPGANVAPLCAATAGPSWAHGHVRQTVAGVESTGGRRRQLTGKPPSGDAASIWRNPPLLRVGTIRPCDFPASGQFGGPTWWAVRYCIAQTSPGLRVPAAGQSVFPPLSARQLTVQAGAVPSNNARLNGSGAGRGAKRRFVDAQNVLGLFVLPSAQNSFRH